MTIGCHGENSLNHPDLWIAAVDTNALNGVVHIPGSIGGLPVKKIGKGGISGMCERDAICCTGRCYLL